MSIGRNDPCSCGSGKKYKHCCLRKTEPSGDEFFRGRFDRERNDLVEMILKHAVATYGENVIGVAWDAFHVWPEEEDEDDGFDPTSAELQLFMPWFFFDWTPDLPETDLLETAPDVPPARSLLEKKGSRLSPLQTEYIELCTMTGLSFLELLEVRPGQGFKTKDILTGEVNEIVEKMGSVDAERGNLLFGKTVTIQGITMLEAVSSIMIPPIYKIQIMDLKKHLNKRNRIITRDVLWEFDFEIRDVYQSIYDEIMNPQMPTLLNTDGSLLVPHKLTYELLISPDEAFDALAVLDIRDSKEQIRLDGEFDGEALQQIEFTWGRLSSNEGRESGTILGNIVIDGSKLVVTVNSAERAGAFDTLMEGLLQGKYKTQPRVIESMEYALANRPPASALDRTEHDELMQNPEVQNHLAQIVKAHWDDWIDQPVPALDNKTPVQATKTKSGREKLDALLTQFEMDASIKPLPGAGPELFREIRAKLGL